MGRTFDRELKCGCLISSDGGGALMGCYSDNCNYGDWMETADYKLHLKEIEERN